MTIKDDQIYIDKTLNGDVNAFSYLIEKYKVMVFSLGMKMLKNKEEAEEIAQDTFIKAYKSLKKFNRESKFSTWLYKIAYRNCLDSLKKITKNYNIEAIDEINSNKIQETTDVLESIERKERAEVMKECLNMLPKEERAILWSFYFDELSLNEITEVTGWSLANVKVRLHRGRKRLLSIVKRNIEPELIKHYGRK
ncbi:RNA polymerase, sigma subunit, ECF family [Tenacibaculum sp. MAR_2009_124]|uniref:RNA polymerase sigma factor n=1 Tax=Tenacibaculum sp. MAR_2009_124 TaxID=1250059 RepID=UPI0008975D20|nr:sigma-70 family RNA polymerase sigma factor [Tenacibaculum sp. MAR_2009_124]SEB44604.1 RNA polymerase, sigma subunit, ECF family [Tenacibaculum sp. MAR_2009_124]